MALLQPSAQYTEDLYLQGGKIYIALKNSDGSYDDFQYFGMTPSMSGTVSIETLDHKQTETMPPSTDFSVVTNIDLTLNAAVDQISQGMLALFFMGETRQKTQAAGSETGSIAVKKGYSYDIGFRNVSGFSLTGSGGSPTYTEGTDYQIDTTTGLLTILQSGGISDGDTVEWSATVPDGTFEIVEGLTKEKIEAKLKFVSDPIAGKQRIWNIHNATVSPSGDFAIKSAEEFAQASFEIKATADTTIAGAGLSQVLSIESV